MSAIDELSPGPASEQAEMKPRSKTTSIIRRVLREPLVHFLLIGIALFAFYGLLAPTLSQPSSNRIELTKDDLNQLQVTWMAQWKRPPTTDEMKGLIETRVRQEIMYREALARGLDEGDEIVKRRLAQKMDFLTDDVSAIREPESSELRAWFNQNPMRFALPSHITFHHLYFSPDKRGRQTQSDAQLAFERLSTKPLEAAQALNIGDPFMDKGYFADSLPEQISRVFGTKFSESLFKLKSGSWQGPVESGLGWHLVWVETLTPGRPQEFEEADPAQVRNEWISAQREESKSKAFAAIRQRYEIVVPE